MARTAEDKVGSSQKVAALLGSLPNVPDVKTEVSNIMSQGVQDYEDVKARLLKFFSRETSMLASEEAKAASEGFAVARIEQSSRPPRGRGRGRGRSRGRGRGRGRGGKVACNDDAEVCGHCGRAGHNEQSCYKKHPQLRGKLYCNYCEKSGHLEKDCRKKQRDEERKQENKEEKKSCFLCTTLALDSTKDKSNSLLIDSGSEVHICHNKDLFIELHKMDKPVTLRSFDQSVSVEVTHEGTIELPLKLNGKTAWTQFTECKFVPQARINVLSSTVLNKKGVSDQTQPPARGKPGVWTSSYEGKPVVKATLIGSKYLVDLVETELPTSSSVVAVDHPVKQASTPIADTTTVVNQSASAELPKALLGAEIGLLDDAKPQLASQSVHSGETQAKSSTVSQSASAELPKALLGAEIGLLDDVKSQLASQSVQSGESQEKKAQTSTDFEGENVAAEHKSVDVMKMHQRLGHLNVESLIKMLKDNGFDVTGDKQAVKDCESCKLGKMHRLPKPTKAKTRSTRPLERAHTDVCGPMPVHSVAEGAKYMLVFVDDYSRYVETAFITTKGEAADKLQELINYWEQHLGVRLKFIRSDNGGEFTGYVIVKFFRDKGIHHERTVPGNPHMDGVSERMNCTLEERARTGMIAAGMHMIFWAEAIRWAADVTNNVPCSANKGIAPVTLFLGKKPNLQGLYPFGSLVYAHTDKGSKLQPRSTACAYLGREARSKAPRLWDMEKARLFISRDVVFMEHVFHSSRNSKHKANTYLCLCLRSSLHAQRLLWLYLRLTKTQQRKPHLSNEKHHKHKHQHQQSSLLKHTQQWWPLKRKEQEQHNSKEQLVKQKKNKFKKKQSSKSQQRSNKLVVMNSKHKKSK